MTLILYSMLLISFLMYSSSFPFLSLILVILYTLMICLLMKTILNTMWFSFLLFLIFISGLLILFSYITGLAPNKTPLNFLFNTSSSPMFNYYTNINFLMFMFMILLISLMNIKFTNTFNFYFYNNIFSSFTTLNFMFSIFKIYSPSFLLIITIIILFLLLTLFVSVDIILTNKGPLRKTIKTHTNVK